MSSDCYDEILNSSINKDTLPKEEDSRECRIDSFRGSYLFLSNFYESPVEYKGLRYQCSEAAYQAQKCVDESDKQRFTVFSAKEAKAMGQKVNVRPDWDIIKLEEMERIVRAKFQQNKDIAEKLIETHPRNLVEANNWGDDFWGYDLCRQEGLNHLGKILMRIRDELCREAGAFPDER